jgi:hypothetical protein
MLSAFFLSPMYHSEFGHAISNLPAFPRASGV